MPHRRTTPIPITKGIIKTMNSTATQLEPPTVAAVADAPDIHIHEPSEPERTLGKLTFSNRNHSRFTVQCDALALSNFGYGSYNSTLAIASLIGPATSVKAAAAILNTNLSAEIRTSDFNCETMCNSYRVERSDAGYRVYRHRLPLPFAIWHCLAVAKDSRLIPHMSDEALWMKLKSDAFTTPILRGWMPWLRWAMERENLLRYPPAFQCSPAVFYCDQSALDNLVSDGLREGNLTI